MPPTVLLAVLSVCIYWGWLREAGIFALSWGGLLRIGEALATTRKNLILPSDVLFAHTHILVRIEEPKTRMRTARHQAAKVDYPDLVCLIALAFSSFEPQEKLWSHSPQTLRRRFDLVLECIGIVARDHQRPLDLGSFRPGGAFLLATTEDSERVRRRGRWASHKVMEIYIQEVSACTFFPDLPLEIRHRVSDLAQSFPSLLLKAKAWTEMKVPTTSWYSLLSAGERPYTG